jgi:hypothetical protein
MKLKLNDYAMTKNNNYFGKISAIHKSCPQSNIWLKNLEIPVKAEDVRSTWYSIICITGGEIVTPASDIEKIGKRDTIIKELEKVILKNNQFEFIPQL